MTDHHYEESQDHNSTMKRSNPPPHLTLFSPSSSRRRAEYLPSATSSGSWKSPLPNTAPLSHQQQCLPDLRLQPASSEPSPATTPTSPRRPFISHKSSYESFFEPPRPLSLERGESMETVKGVYPSTTTTPMRLEEGQCEPLRPHGSPRYGSEESHGYYGTLADRVQVSPSTTTVTGLMTTTAVSRWMISSVMHGVTLVIQCMVTFAVMCAIVGVTVWKKNDIDPGFWSL